MCQSTYSAAASATSLIDFHPPARPHRQRGRCEGCPCPTQASAGEDHPGRGLGLVGGAGQVVTYPCSSPMSRAHVVA